MRLRQVHLVYFVVCLVLLITGSACAGEQMSKSLSTATPGNIGTPTPASLYQSSLKSPLDGWPNDQNTFPASDGYHIVGGYLAYAPIGNQNDVSISVQVKQVSGPLQADYGIAFRHTPGNRYEFDINSSGEWYVLKDVNTQHSNLVDLTPNSAIHTGLNTTNTLKVEAKGGHFTFFINGIQVGQANDTANSTGEVGIDGDDNTVVVFSTFEVVALH